MIVGVQKIGCPSLHRYVKCPCTRCVFDKILKALFGFFPPTNYCAKNMGFIFCSKKRHVIWADNPIKVRWRERWVSVYVCVIMIWLWAAEKLSTNSISLHGKVIDYLMEWLVADRVTCVFACADFFTFVKVSRPSPLILKFVYMFSNIVLVNTVG